MWWYSLDDSGQGHCKYTEYKDIRHRLLQQQTNEHR